MSDRRESLRNYLFAVVRDLAVRGAIRHHRGQGFEQILRAEWPTVLDEVRKDVVGVAAQLGIEFVDAARPIVEGLIAREVGNFTSHLSSLLRGRKH